MRGRKRGDRKQSVRQPDSCMHAGGEPEDIATWDSRSRSRSLPGCCRHVPRRRWHHRTDDNDSPSPDVDSGPRDVDATAYHFDVPLDDERPVRDHDRAVDIVDNSDDFDRSWIALRLGNDVYERRIDRRSPACFILLIDQSDSMGDPVAGEASLSKAQAVADRVNVVLYELVVRSVKTPAEGPRPYFAVAVIGYSTDTAGAPVVQSALPRSLSDSPFVWTRDLATNPLRVEQRLVPGGANAVNFPVWVSPVNQGGTPMSAAFDRAGRLAQAWVQDRPSGFPPIVINMSDGESTDGIPTVWAARLRRLQTDDGSLLLFNLNLSSRAGDTILFPNSDAGLPSDYARQLYEMSSELPDMMIEGGTARGLALRPGARGFGFNADFRSVVSFLSVGTSIDRLLR